MKKLICIFLSIVFCMALLCPAVGADAPSASDFSDLDSGRYYYYYSGVDYCVRHGLMNGVSGDTFAPNASMTRAMFVTVLYRMSGESAPDSENVFADLKADAYYMDAVRWGLANGIVSGTSESSFSPDAPVTREMMCTFIVRYARHKGYSMPQGAPNKDCTPIWVNMFLFESELTPVMPLEDPVKLTVFDDNDKIHPYALDAVYSCYRAGIVNGIDKDTYYAYLHLFSPGEVATRGQVATALRRFLRYATVTEKTEEQENKRITTYSDQYDAFATRTETYDGDGNLLSEVYTDDEGNKRTETYTYGQNGLPTEWTRTQTGEKPITVEIRIDQQAMTATLTTVGFPTATLTYDGQGRVVRVAYEEEDYGFVEKTELSWHYNDAGKVDAYRSSVSNSYLGKKFRTKYIEDHYRYDEQGIVVEVNHRVDSNDGVTISIITADAERTWYKESVRSRLSYRSYSTYWEALYDMKTESRTVTENGKSRTQSIYDWLHPSIVFYPE